MSIWDDIGGAISDAADAVAGAVEDVVNAVEEAVTDIVETIGNAVSDGLGAIGDLLGKIPGIGGVVSAVFHWLGDVVSGITDLVGAVIKGVLGIVSGVIAGVIRIVFGGIGGLIAWDGRVFVKGLKDIAAGIGGAVIFILGKVVGLVQSVIPLQWGKRRLTRSEQALLRKVFRGSIALYNVRVIEGFAGLFSINDRPFTLGNTIYLKDHNAAAEPELLVHECVHVWQYQNEGSRYVADALGAQAFVENEYSWEQELARGDTQWQEFNAEAQAELFEDVYTEGRRSGSGPGPIPGTLGGPGVFFDDDPVGLVFAVEFMFNSVDHTVLAKRSAQHVRDARAARLSALWS